MEITSTIPTVSFLDPHKIEKEGENSGKWAEMEVIVHCAWYAGTLVIDF